MEHSMLFLFLLFFFKVRSSRAREKEAFFIFGFFPTNFVFFKVKKKGRRQSESSPPPDPGPQQISLLSSVWDFVTLNRRKERIFPSGPLACVIERKGPRTPESPHFAIPLKFMAKGRLKTLFWIYVTCTNFFTSKHYSDNVCQTICIRRI